METRNQIGFLLEKSRVFSFSTLFTFTDLPKRVNAFLVISHN